MDSALEYSWVMSKPDSKRDFFDWADLLIKTVGSIIAIVVVLQASATYKRDVDARLLDQRLKIFNDALSAAGDVVSADNPQSFRKALYHFGAVKHGQVLAVLGNGAAYNAMVKLWNDALPDLYVKPEKLKDDQSGALEHDFEAIAAQFQSVVASK